MCSVARVGLSVHNPRILCTSITSRTLSGKAGKTQYRRNYIFMCLSRVSDDQ